MKLGRLLALGTLACGAYYAHKRREDIKEEILDPTNHEKISLTIWTESNATLTSSRNKTLCLMTSNKTSTIKHASSKKT